MAESGGKRPPVYVQFASVMMAGIGFFALLSAVAELAGSSTLRGGSILGDALDLGWFGAVDGLIAIASFYAAYGIWRGQKAGYWIGFIVAIANATRWLVFLPLAPIWSVAMVALWCLVTYCLTSSDDYFA